MCSVRWDWVDGWEQLGKMRVLRMGFGGDFRGEKARRRFQSNRQLNWELLDLDEGEVRPRRRRWLVGGDGPEA
jgi:hypothetical protein